MFSSTEKFKCLIVEDDQFKMEGIRSHLNEIFNDRIEVFECQALASATALLASQVFDLAIIDMSIHSHEPQAGAGSPFPLSSGGLDVLFEIASTENNTSCIILTQYPDIEIESLPIPVDLAKKEILEKFDIEVAGCVRYLENDNQWKSEINYILEKL
jgi:ActR/RegA family two-component response regulator